jgi:pimeloyl-ACP methyl ester carboxylesterase
MLAADRSESPCRHRACEAGSVSTTANDVEREPGPHAALVGRGAVRDARAVALVLHGGKEESLALAGARQVAVLRMAPIARRLANAAADGGLAVWRLRFRYRGWNREAAHPVADVRWALRQLRERHGDVPVVLVGHSMGGRAAFRAAGADGVTAVVGLAPWLPAGEPLEQLAGRRLFVVHGLRDRITSARLSRSFVEKARPIAAEAGLIEVRRSGHGMVRRYGLWNDLTATFVMHAAFGTPPAGPVADALRTGYAEV